MEQTDIDPETLNRPEWNSLLENYSLHDVGEAYFRGRTDQLGLEAESWGIDERHNDEGLVFDNKMDLRLWEPLDGQKHPPKGGGFVPSPPLHKEPVDMELFEAAVDELGSVDMAEFETEEWELKGVVDIKTKSSSSWMGKFNLRHLAHYAEHAANYNVPVFLFFTIVNRENEEVGDESMVVPITTDWDYEALVEHYDRDNNYQLSGKELNETAQQCDMVKGTFRAPDGNMVVEVDSAYEKDFDWVVANVL